MLLLADWLPEPPAIVATLATEAISEERLAPEAQPSEDQLVRYANEVKAGLEGLADEARKGRLDVEKLLWEVRQQEADKLRSSRYWEKRVKNWKKEISKFKPLLRNPLTRGKAQQAVVEAETHARYAETVWRIDRDVYRAFLRCREELSEIRRARLNAYRQEFEAFLPTLAEQASAEAFAAAKWGWDSLKPSLPAPECSVVDEGVVFVWDNGPHHLQLDFLSPGLYDWFYRNRETNSIDGDEDLAPGNLPSRLLALVQEFRDWS